MHRLGAVAHKSSTRLCTGSREAVLLSAGRQQRIGAGAGTCMPASAPRARSRDTLVPSPPRRVRTDVRRCRAHVVRRWEPSRESGRALVGTDMIKVLANRKPVPAADGCRILCNLSVAAGILVTHTVDICAMRANSQSQAFEAKLARLMWQAGKRCYRRRPRRR
jgi:hypothetical protein